MSHLELQKEDFTLSSDPARLDVDAIYSFLSQSYWARQRPRDVLERAIQNSFCMGLYLGAAQVGFGRAVTDYATFAYLADVYVLEKYRRRGLAKWLVEALVRHPDLVRLRRWMLATTTADGLYASLGFSPLTDPANFMELLRPYPSVHEETDVPIPSR